MLKVQGSRAFLAKLKKAKNGIEGRVTRAHQDIVKAIFTDLVQNSPQWSGNLAQQWSIDFHGNKGSYKPVQGYGQSLEGGDVPYQRGDNPAVGSTLSRELPKIPFIRWNSKVTITNYAPYASDVENNIGPEGKGIREVNKLESYGKVAMVGYVTMKYSNLRHLRKATQ